jgi:hypothetical protein
MNGTTDYLQAMVYHNHGSALDTNADDQTFFGAHRIG